MILIKTYIIQLTSKYILLQQYKHYKDRTSKDLTIRREKYIIIIILKYYRHILFAVYFASQQI